MSVEVLLVPFGIALIQAVISARKTIQERQDTVVLEPVRIVDTGLLGRALDRLYQVGDQIRTTLILVLHL